MFPWVNFPSYPVITAATPGPNNLMSLSNAGRMGFSKAFPFNLGIGVGFSAVSLACAFFCGALTSLIPRLKFPMLVIGAAYMLRLAWKTMKSPAVTEETHAPAGFLSGLALQFINPKIYIYCIVSMETYILPFYQGNWGALALFALLLALIGFSFTVCWAAFGSVFQLLFSKYARITNPVMALLLVYSALSLFR